MFGLTIKNFRSLKDQHFDFSRVNILIGENSSGKSTVLKFLMLLNRSERLNTSNFKFTNEIGRFKDFVYDNNMELKVSFSLKFDDEYLKFISKVSDDFTPGLKDVVARMKGLNANENEISVSFSFDKNVRQSNDMQMLIENKHLGALTLIRDYNEKPILGQTCKIHYVRANGEKFRYNNISFNQNGFLSIVHGTSFRERYTDQKQDKNNSDEVYNEIAYLLISQNYTQEILHKMSYLNPLESTPERIYDENENQGFLYKIRTIQDVVNILSDDTLDKNFINALENELRKYLRKYGLLWDFKASSSNFGAREFRVKVRKEDVWCSIKDVGYGSSLQIPLIFQAILSEGHGGEVILIEQPEIHIHPYLQSKFIEILLSIGKKNQYIIETHSVDLVRKLQVLVKKQEFSLASEDVNIYYFRKPAKKSIVSNHHINKLGKLEPKFPPGFYDSSVNLVKELF